MCRLKKEVHLKIYQKLGNGIKSVNNSNKTMNLIQLSTNLGTIIYRGKVEIQELKCCQKRMI